jgi:hypothetical protein
MKLIAVALLGALVVSGVVASVYANGWLRRAGPARPTACAGTAPLVAQSRAGMPWHLHRHRLIPDEVQVGRHDSYLVRNERTGELFRWGRARDQSSPVRILVPTRYAEIINRRWRDDRWSYCLVLAPDPPFHTRYWGFDTSIVIAAPELEAGAATTIDVFIVGEAATTVLVDVEVRDADGRRVAQWVWDDQQLSAGARTRYTMRWEIPPATAPGLYAVKVGLFAPGWGNVRHWNDGTAILFVRPATASGP